MGESGRHWGKRVRARETRRERDRDTETIGERGREIERH